jgi:catechol 2,3-dioxygenase-like lactoylglutathione lyase family enzyme
MRDPYANERPPLWVGHVMLAARNVPEARAYWQALGMRFIAEGDGFAVLELRGGTHLVIVPAEAPIEPGTPAPFDVMVDDIDSARADYARRGLDPSPMKEGRIHRSFTLRDPSGYLVTVNSSHASDRPV